MAKDKSDPLLPPPVTPPTGEDDGFVPLPSPEEVLAQSSGISIPTPSGAAIVNGSFVDTDRPVADPPVDPLIAAKQAAPVTDTLGGAINGVFKAGDASNNLTAAGIDAAKRAAGGVAKLFKPSAADRIDAWVHESGAADQIRENVQDFKNSPERQLFQPQTISGNITSGVSQFVVGLIGAGKLLKGAGILQGTSKVAGIARGLTAGAMADATVFDHEARLSNLVEEFPSLSNPISRYLAADPNDSFAEDRLKSVLEGAVAGSMVESAIAAIRGIRGIRAARKVGGETAAENAAVALSDELETIQSGGSDYLKRKAELEAGGALPTAAPRNVPPIPQGIQEYIAERLAKGSDFDPGYSRDFNAAKQVTTDGARQAINLASDALAPEIDKLKGGVQTFDTITRLATLAKEDPFVLRARMSANAKNANRLASDVKATEEVMLLLARQVSDEARRLDTGVVTDPAYFHSLQDTLGSIVADLKAVKTGAARTTSAGRMVKTAADLDPGELKALIAAGGDVEKVVPIIAPKSWLRKTVEAHNEVWINALLSGPKTHLVNATSNLLNTFARPIEKALGGQVREGLADFMGMAKGIRDSVSMAAKAWRLEESVIQPGSLKVDDGRFAISSGRFGLDPKGVMGTSIDWLGKAVRLPTRFLLASDELFRQVNYRANVYSRATREGLEKGLDGPALANYIEDRFASAFDGTGKGLDEAALREAKLATFTEELTPGGPFEKLQTAVNAHPGLRLILPFVKTPTNIVKQLGWHTPLVNLAMGSYWAELRAGGARAAVARGQMATGGMLWSAGLLLAAEGKITGRGPENADERATLMATGWRPYSVKVGDTYLEYGRLDPYGMALGLAADFTEAHGHLSEEHRGNLATAMLGALARNLSSKTYLRGVTEMLDAFSQPDQKAERWLQSRVGSYMPSAGQQIAGLVGGGDDTMREVRSMMDAIYARTPGLSKTLPPKRNILGEPIRYPPALGPDSISPFAMSTDLHDPVKAELARLSFAFRAPATSVGHVDLTKYRNAKGQDAYDRLLELRTTETKGGRTLKARLNAEISSERYQRLPDGNDEYTSKKLYRVQLILGEYQEACMKKLRREFPELERDIRTDEHNARAVKRSGVGAIQEFLKP